jgi:7-carboxy-7-deazaguanine synthase
LVRGNFPEVALNDQPIEKRASRTDGQLDVHSIFLTIQGEGPFCGTPCVFVRLAGCNLQCPACDTDYTSKRKLMGPYEVLSEVNELWRADEWRRGLVVVTGGEPFRQDLSELFHVLCGNGYYIQVESNGTLPPSPALYTKSVALDNREGVYVVCSPKTGKLNPRIFEVACALKYVVRYNMADPDDGLPTSALDHTGRPARPPEGWDRLIYIQPLDSGNVLDNDFNTAEALSSALKHGYTLQLQIHKFLGVE